MFNGSLDLLLRGGIEPIVHRLLSLPGGIHFWALTLTWFRKEDISLTMALVEKCSHTLESLDITRDSSCGTSTEHLRSHGSNSLFPVDPVSVLFDLSKATKLGCAVFRPGSLRVGWIAHALRAVTSKHRDLRRISVDVPFLRAFPYVDGDIRKVVGGRISDQRLDLDCILVHLWESFSIRANVRRAGRGEETTANYVWICCRR